MSGAGVARVESIRAQNEGLYLRYYRLGAKPFNLTPDPRFLFLTPSHREALAQLVYGVQERKGFILLTGEVGTGKTTLLRTLLTRVDEKTEVALVINATLQFDELLEYILADFGIGGVGGGRAQRLMALNKFLIDYRRGGMNAVLILDEAQNFDVRTLEQIRLLSNFETHSEKLLQIVLAGQPELRAKLQQPELRQLRQRIGLRCAIQPLDAEQVEQYIVSHLRVARATDLQLFSRAAIRRITAYSRGIPRVVNMVCDQSLLVGYANQVRRIDAEIVKRAIAYLEEGAAAEARSSRLGPVGWWPTVARYTGGVLAACAAGAAALVVLSSYAGDLDRLSTALVGSFFDFLQRALHWWR
jgi:general secretion pathway protein A